MTLQPISQATTGNYPPASSSNGPTGEAAQSFDSVMSDVTKAVNGLEPATPDPSIAKPLAPPAGSPQFVAAGPLTADMAAMLNEGWSPALLVPPHPYSPQDSDYRLGFGADGTLTGYQQRMVDAGIMRQSGPGQTQSINSSGPGATLYAPAASQSQAAAAVSAPAEDMSEPSKAVTISARVVAPPVTAAPEVPSPQPSPAAVGEGAPGPSLVDELVQQWAQRMLANGADLPMPE